MRIRRMTMELKARDVCGKTLFYALDTVAEHFLKTFPHSQGKRKSLTKSQVKMLAALGVEIRIR